MSLSVESVEGESCEYRVLRDGELLMHCSTGGTGPCWNLAMLDGEGHFGPLGGSGGEDGEPIHICELDEFIDALIALRDSDAHRENVERWQR